MSLEPRLRVLMLLLDVSNAADSFLLRAEFILDVVRLLFESRFILDAVRLLFESKKENYVKKEEFWL